MKVSELIAMLEELLKIHGDLPVKGHNDVYGYDDILPPEKRSPEKRIPEDDSSPYDAPLTENSIVIY